MSLKKHAEFVSFRSSPRKPGGIHAAAVLYLRVSTIEQTTANQERELRQVAERMGCDIVKVYKDHGVSGAKGRDKRPQFVEPRASTG